MKNILFKYSLFLIFLFNAESSKILVFSPTISRSHMISNARIADTLASDGHNVTLLEVEFFEKIGELNASKVANTILVPGQFIDPKEFNTSMIAEMSFKNVYLPMDFLVGSIIQTTFNNACEKFLLVSEKLFDKLRNEKFDIIISEQLNSCGAGVGHLLNIPTNILVSSCPIQEHIASILGLSNPASYIPSLYYSNLPDKMSIYERTTNLFRQFAESPFVFVNVDEFLDFPRPIFSNIIYIGGLGMEEGKNTKINKNEDPINIEMSKGKKGVIFFSTGSVVKTTYMDENFRRNVLLTFSQLTDYHFIVKIENDDKFSLNFAKQFKNIFAISWAPQTFILKHPRLKLFITHGGYNSLMESARSGIPLISMGFFADQYRNGRVAERNGWGLPFDKRLLLNGNEEFKKAVLKVIENPSYLKSAKRIQKLVLNKPFSAEERLLRSIRFLEISGGKLPELLPESRNMSTIAFYNLDILILATISSILLIFIFWRFLKFLSGGYIVVNKIYSTFFNKKKEKENKKNE
uniref:glucuronosyltransferase n=1 Tax=Meloidogyne enterolobii TaxID=390850 RepID=A0A6V7VNX0_MELEN|nr:unnamed protein product [Meloidogyne enterolobii]